MKIIRTTNGEEVIIEVTVEEFMKIRKEDIVSIMTDILESKFNVKNERTSEFAEKAYDLFCKDDSLTGHECIKTVVEKEDE